MHTFKDANGDEWVIELDTTMTRAIRKELGVDLLILDENSISSLTTNDETLVDVIAFICSEQIKRKDLDGSGFARCLIGKALDDACDALVDEVVFISRHHRGTVVAKAWEKTKAAEGLLTEKAIKMIDTIDMEKMATKAFQEAEAQLGIS